MMTEPVVLSAILLRFHSHLLSFQILSVGAGWEESKLHEHPNEYVAFLCDFMAILWCKLTTSSCLLPSGILKAVWGDLVGGGYMVLLDAFAKVPYCSTEGRALMRMDLASYSSRTQFQSIAATLEGHPEAIMVFPEFSSYRNMAYVDIYIKLFYFPAMVSSHSESSGLGCPIEFQIQSPCPLTSTFAQ
jgi:Protein of unknown function C-terminus (DUF2451)